MLNAVSIKETKEKLKYLKQKKKFHQEQVKTLKNKLKQLEKDERDIQTLQQIIQHVADEAMQTITGSVSSLTTEALQAIFGKHLAFKAKVVIQRGRPIVDLTLYDNDHPLDPLLNAGGGVADVCSFALRTTFWGLHGELRPILCLDEPFKFVSADLQPYCAQFLRELSNKLKIQFIIISHIPHLINEADTIFKVERRDNISVVKKVKEGC